MKKKSKKVNRCFEGKIRNWAMGYLRSRFWRVASYCDDNDLQQGAYLCYLDCCRIHPELTDPEKFFRYYKSVLPFRLSTWGKSAFPNPFNASKENRVVQPGPDYDTFKDSGLYGCVVNEMEEFLDIIQRVPNELREVTIILIREIIGIGNLKFRERPSRGKASRESLNRALTRMARLDASRDVLSELHEFLVTSKKEVGVIYNG